MKNKKEFLFSVLVISFLAAIAYLPFSTKLGFYYNDWHPILAKITNTNIFSMFYADRPALGLIYPFTYGFWGDSPFAWQIFGFFLRILTSVAFLTILRQIWPDVKTPSTIMAILFVLYPGFMQQPLAITFSNHLIGLSSGLISISLSLLFLKISKEKRIFRYSLLFLSLFLELIYLFIYEYMIGLEIVRYILIWYLLFPNSLLKIKNNFWIFFKNIWFYFIPLARFLYFRFVSFNSARPTTNIDNLLNLYFQQPFKMLGNAIVDFFQAIMNTTLFAWVVPLYDRLGFIGSKEFLPAIFLAGGAVFISFLILKEPVHQEKRIGIKSWEKDSVILGTIFLISTLLPITITNRDVIFRNLLDRYTLQSAFAASMIIIGLSYILFKGKYVKIFSLSLIFVSILFNFGNSIYWKNHWDFQKSLFWQLSWRAPQIKPETVLLALQPEGYLFREDEDVYAPANLIYYPDSDFLHIYSEVLSDATSADIIFQRETFRNYRTFQFVREFDQSLIISNTNPDACIHVIDGEKPELVSKEKSLIRLVAPYSNIDQIMADRESNLPPMNPFGKEPVHDWCYFYQKAQLARQLGDWDEVIALWEEASNSGFSAKDVSEWMPFIEAYAVKDRLVEAEMMVSQVNSVPEVRNYICENYDPMQNVNLSWESDIYHNLCQRESN